MEKARDFGSTFEFDGKIFIVVHKVKCQECCFWQNRGCFKPKIAGPCSSIFSDDRKNRVFQIKKQLDITFNI